MSHVDEGTLHAYLDGELPAGPERRALEVHLMSCTTCRSALQEARALREKSVSILEKSVPKPAVAAPPFEEIVARAQARSSGHAARRLSRMRALAWAATIVVAAGVGSVVTLQLRAPREAPVSQPSAMDEPARLAQKAERSLAPAEPEPPEAANRRQDLSARSVPGDQEQQTEDEFAAVSSTARRDVVAGTGLATGAIAQAPDTPAAVAELDVVLMDSAAPVAAADARDVALRGRVARPVEGDSLVGREGFVQAAPAAAFEEARGVDRDAPAWTEASESTASEALEGPVAEIEGLSVEGYAIRSVGERSQVKVIQRTEAGVVVEVIQWKIVDTDSALGLMEKMPVAAPAQKPLTTLSARRDDHNILLRADLSEDELRRLLERIR